MTTPDPHSPAKRFKLSFSLRMLLALIFGCAVAAAVWAEVIAPRLSAERQRRLYARLRERGIEMFGPKASNLRWDQTLTRDDVALLSEAPGLTAFHWKGCKDETLRQLSQLKQLQLLDVEFAVSGVPFTEAGLTHLAQLPNLRALRIADYSWTHEELRRLGQLKQLEFLALESWLNDSVFDVGAANWSGLKQLHTLDLESMRLTENGLRQLAQLPELKSLTFRHCSGLTDGAMARLGEMRQLKELNFLHCSRLTDEGIRRLSSLKDLESLSLVCVGVSEDDFTDAGMRHLSGLSKLKHLCLYSPRLTDDFFLTMHDMPHLSLLVLGLAPPHSSPSKEVALWLDTVHPAILDALADDADLDPEDASLKQPRLQVQTARHLWSEYTVREMFNEHTLHSFESDLRGRSGG